MTTALGLLGIVAFIIGTISVAAAITYVVVRVSPAKKPAANGQTKS